MASSQELTNSTIVPLGPNGIFEGRAYRTVGFTSVHFTLQADKVCTLTIEQTTSSNQWQVSDEFSNGKHITTVVDGLADKVHLQCSVIVKGNFFRVRLQNTTADTLAITRLFAYPKTSVQQSNIDIRRLEAGVDSVTTDQMVTTATRPIRDLVVNTWYRVASVGNTSGAAWNAIGAIVGGESQPTIGRLFKCLSVPGPVAGEGTCYDVEYNDNTVTSITGTVSLGAGTESVGTVRMRDAYGDPILTTAGNLMVGISNIYTANPLHTIIDSGSVTFTEASASVVSLSTITNTHQDIKNAPGTLKSILITYDNAIAGIIAYVKLYDNLTPTGTSVPKIVLPVVSGTTIQFDCHSLAFATGITIRNVDSFGSGGTPPSGTLYATVLYN
tara:strand:+ start:3805 stop:4959 length:1155 start_codon:yes stop_codon:yes gene_type:complete